MTTSLDYSASTILDIVDGAELVRVIDDRHLCVWGGGNNIDVYDLTDSDAESDIIMTPMFGELTRTLIFDLIEDHFYGKQND